MNRKRKLKAVKKSSKDKKKVDLPKPSGNSTAVRVPSYVPPPKITKKLIYDRIPVNRHTQFKCQGFVFKFDANLDPVPVEVPSHIADALLQMMDEGCRCHNGEPKKLFCEVN
jgi:hypothetical protein